MIEKMKFLSILGPKDDFDRAVDKYLNKYEIQLENALSELKTVKNLKPFMEANPYKDALSKCEEIITAFPKAEQVAQSGSMSLKDSMQVVEKVEACVRDIETKRQELKGKRKKAGELLNSLEPFRNLDVDISSIFHFQFIKYRFGRFPKEHHTQFMKHVYDDTDTIFLSCKETEDYVWGIYFAPKEKKEEVEAVYASLHFESLFIPDEYEGKPEEALNHLQGIIREYDKGLDELNRQMSGILEENKSSLLQAHETLRALSVNFDLRKMAACTKERSHTFYILCGWMTAEDAESFVNEIKEDEDIFCFIEDDHNNIFSKPPTKLKNPKLFKPFEMYIKMYGLPAHNEMDPTILVALTYSFLFGMMFGDVGQGLVLLIGGALLYHYKKMDLAAIISCAGAFSTFFGFMFGSIFGFEDAIEAVWIRPISQMQMLPFIGRLNLVFVVAIAMGMGLILLSMVLNIINSVRMGDVEKAFFDTNGVAGLIFYGAVVLMVALYMSGRSLPATIVLVVMFVIPLLVMALKEPLTNMVEQKAEIMPKEKGMFIVQTFFEMFEVLLSYFSNTLSFVRVGAFAVSHAAIMEVVLMLAGADKGQTNWLVIILGNLFVMGMEGLIVGIQVLRLEYYEIFSRFYRGTGREFKPYKVK